MKTATAWPRQPFIGIAIAAGGGVLIGELAPFPRVALGFAALAAGVALLRRTSVVTYIFIATCFCALHALRITDAPGLLLARELGNGPVAITARGAVVSEPKISAQGNASFFLRLNSIERHGITFPTHATISARWRGEAQFGDELQLFGVAQPIAGPRNPGELDMRSYLARRDIHDVIVTRYPENGRLLRRNGGNSILRAAHASRHWMEATLSRDLEDSPEVRSVICGIILGLRDQTPDEVEDQFQQTGTIHLFAVAGLHVGMVAYLLWALASALRLPRKWATGLIIPGLFFYAAITGLNTSSLRAATMAAVLLGGVFFERKVHRGNSLAAAAVLILCYDTNQLFSIGFQLSFSVVTTILFLADPIFNMLARWCEPDPFLPKALVSGMQRAIAAVWRKIARGASVSLAAWIGSLPLILPYFYLITPVSLFANLTVVPIAFFVLAAGLLSILVTPIAGWLAIIFNNANWSLASAILGIVGLFARAPAGHFYIGQPHWPDGARAEITVLDLGAGGAAHVRSSGNDWLIDCGAERDFGRIVRGYLRSRGVNQLSGLVLTHGDSAHIGAAIPVLRAFRPAQLVDNAPLDKSSAHKQLIEYADEHQIARQLRTAPEEFAIGKNIIARVLFPPAGFRGGTADDQALVLKLTVAGQWRVLLMSDSGEATERWLVEHGTDLRSDVIVKGQHRSGISGTPAFLDQVQPEAIIASSSSLVENERVKDDWAALLQTRGIKLLREDETGAVTLRFFRDRWEARSYMRPEIFRSASRKISSPAAR